MDFLWLTGFGLTLGLVLGALGTLTGIGGGFLLMPALLWALPQAAPGTLALASLTLVFFNSLSGTVLAFRRDRIRWATALTYITLTLVPVWWASQLQGAVDRASFDRAFGLLLLVGAVLLVVKKAPAPVKNLPRGRWVLLLPLAPGVGLVSGFFGVGGGFLLVPLFVHGLRMAVVEATATSQLIVGVGALAGLLSLLGHQPMAIPSSLLGGLVAGVLLGAPMGTRLADRIPGPRVLQVLAGLLTLAALKFLWPVNI